MTEQTVNRDYRVMRRKLGLNQSQFWAAVKVTQSGSRYESGRQAPAKSTSWCVCAMSWALIPP
jgi:predicted transcriptional regulator